MSEHPSDVEDQLFEDDFAGDWTTLPAFDCPRPESLPPAGLDLIERRLGVHMNDEAIPWPRRLAAAEWFFRNAAGQRVTYRQVLRGGSGFTAFMSAADDERGDKADPTQAGETGCDSA